MHFAVIPVVHVPNQSPLFTRDAALAPYSLLSNHGLPIPPHHAASGCDFRSSRLSDRFAQNRNYESIDSATEYVAYRTLNNYVFAGMYIHALYPNKAHRAIKVTEQYIDALFFHCVL